MLSHKIGLIIAVISLSSVALADNPFKVEWTLTGVEEAPVPLAKESYTFKSNGMNCEVSRAVKEYAPDLGLGLTESRNLTCKLNKKQVVSQSVYCTRKQIENSATVEVGNKAFQLSCNTQ